MLTATQLSTMRSAAATTMQDTCMVGTRTRTADSHGQLVATYTDAAPIACGFDPSGGRGVYNAVQDAGGVQLTTDEARLRVPLGTVIAQGDRVTITERLGEALVAPLPAYIVVGPVRRGTTALVCSLESVTP